MSWLRKAAAQGDRSAQHNLATCLLNGFGVPKDESGAATWFTKAADLGLSSAQVAIGDLLAEGTGIAKDEKKAVEWYRKAADQNDAEGHLRLGKCFENGRGVKRDKLQALACYRAGHAQGLFAAHSAMFWLERELDGRGDKLEDEATPDEPAEQRKRFILALARYDFDGAAIGITKSPV